MCDVHITYKYGFLCCQFYLTVSTPCSARQWIFSASLHPHLALQDHNIIITTTFKMTMSTKRPHWSSDDKFNVRRFINDVVMETDGEEEVDKEEEDPDQSESLPLYPFYLAQLTQHNFLLMMMTVTPLMPFIMIPMIVLLLPQTMQRRLPKSSSKLELLINTTYLNVQLASLTASFIVNPCIRQHNMVWTCIVSMSQ